MLLLPAVGRDAVLVQIPSILHILVTPSCLSQPRLGFLGPLQPRAMERTTMNDHESPADDARRDLQYPSYAKLFALRVAETWIDHVRPFSLPSYAALCGPANQPFESIFQESFSALRHASIMIIYFCVLA